MYVIELALKFSPIPLSVQRKELKDAESLYQNIRQSIEKGHPRLMDLTCEKLETKKIAVISSEILAVQIYEKTASLGGNKRPGFSFED